MKICQYFAIIILFVLDVTVVVQTDATSLSTNIVGHDNNTKIAELITEATDDINNTRLTTPKGNNAFEKIMIILNVDSNNAEAKRLLSKVLKSYESLISKTLNAKKISEACMYLNSAYEVVKLSESEKDLSTIERINTKYISTLLLLASNDIQDQHYSTPKENNALDKIEKVLAIEPNNIDANSYIRIIVKKYIELFKKYSEKKELSKANMFLFRASDIAVKHKSAVKLQNIKQQEIIDKILSEAKNYFNAKQFLGNIKNNATEKYKQVLLIDPSNSEALNGLNSIVDIFLFKAKEYIKEKNFSKAELETDRAAYVIPDEDRIIDLKNKLQKLKNEHIKELLTFAEIDFANKRFITPKGKNALEKVKSIIDIDPNNKKANIVLNNILSYYLSNAKKFMKKGDWLKTSEYLSYAKQVSPNDSKVYDLENKLISEKNVSSSFSRLVPSKQLMVLKYSKISSLKIFRDWLEGESIIFADLMSMEVDDLYNTFGKKAYFLEKNSYSEMDSELIEKLSKWKFRLYFLPNPTDVNVLIAKIPSDIIQESGIEYISIVYHEPNRPSGYYNLISYYIFGPNFRAKYNKNIQIEKILKVYEDLHLKSNKLSENFNYNTIDYVRTPNPKSNILRIINELEHEGIVEYAYPFQIGLR